MLETRLFRKHRNEVLEVELDNYVKEILENYMSSGEISDKSKAARDLIIKGYWYWLLEKKYGVEGAKSLEAWDRTYSCLKVESGYLYYRLRLSDVIEELRNLLFIFSGLLSDLSTCYRELRRRDPNVKVNEGKIREYKEKLDRYMSEYVLSLRRELETRKYVENEQSFLNELEDIIKRYRERFCRKES